MKALKILILIGAISILQLYSAYFWMSVTGNAIGILLSVMIEVISLWLWYEKNYLTASLASFVVMTGAIFHLVSGSIDKLEDTKQDKVLSKTLQSVTKALEKADDKAWAFTMQKSLVTINTIVKATTKKESKKGIKKESIEFTWAKILIQAIGLIIIQIGQIKIVLSLKNEVPSVKKVPKEPKEQNQDTKETDGRTIKNHDYDKEFIKEVQKVLWELEEKRKELDMGASKFIEDIMLENKSVYTKIGYVLNGTKGGIGLVKLNDLKARLTELKHSN